MKLPIVAMLPPVQTDLLRFRRKQEEPGLWFLALVCFLQYLMGRLYIIESSGASKIFTESALSCLQELNPLYAPAGSVYVWCSTGRCSHQEAQQVRAGFPVDGHGHAR